MELSKTDTTAIKGFAICLLLWHHVFQDTVDYGHLGIALGAVDLFLFLSGFGLTKQYNQLEKPCFRNTVKFLAKRYLKFFLSYWFCFVVIVAVGNLFGYGFTDAYPHSRNTLKCVILDIFGQMGYSSYLRPWWFNKMILQLYLIFPLLYLIVRNKYSAVTGIVVILLLQLFANSIPGNVFFVVEGGTPAFFLGMIFAKHSIVPDFDSEKHRIVAAIVAALLYSGLMILYLMGKMEPYENVVVKAFMAASMVCFYSYAFRGNKVLEFIGKYSTILYLVHTLFLVLIPGVVYAPKFPILVFLLFMALSLAAAILISYLQKLVRYDKLQSYVIKKVDKLL